MCLELLSACGGGGGGSTATIPPGSFTLSTTSVSFSGKHLGAVPATQTVTLHLTSSGAAAAGAAYANGATPATWLTVTGPGAGTGPDFAFSLAINTTSLDSGTYTTVLTFGTTDANSNILQTQPVQISYSLKDGITISQSAESTSFVAGDSFSSEPLQFNVTSPASIQWTATSNMPWLIAPSGTQSGGGVFAVTVNMAGYAAGTYTGTVTLTNAAEPTDTATLPITITVNSPLISAASSNSVALGGTSGRDLTPQQFQFSISTDQGDIPWTATPSTTSGGNWLTVSPANGTVSANTATISIGANTANMASGTYQGQILIQANVNGTLLPLSITVTLNLDQNRLLVSAAGAAFSSFPSRQVLTRTLGVANTWGLTGVHWQSQSDQSWLTATGSGTTGSPLVLTTDPTGLAPGQYIAHLTVSSSDATIESQETVRVGLTVGNTDPVSPIDIPGAAVAALATGPVEPVLFMENSPTGPIYVYDTNTGALLRTLSYAFTQTGNMVVSDDGQTLYAMDIDTLGNWWVRALDATSGTLLNSYLANSALGPPGIGNGTIPFVYARPGAHAVLLTANDGISTDLSTGAKYFLNDISFPSTLAVSPDQTRLYTFPTNGLNSPTESFNIDWSSVPGAGLTANPVSSNYNLGFGNDIAVSADGARVFLSPSFDVLSSTDMSIQATLTPNNRPDSVATSWNGLLATGSNASVGQPNSNPAPYNILIYDAGDNLLTTLQSDPGTGSIAYSLVGDGLRFSGDGTRLVSGTQGGLRIQTLPAP